MRSPEQNLHMISQVPKLMNLQVSIKKLSCGKFHCAILCDDGKIYTMGNNQFGQLGIGREYKSTADDYAASLNSSLHMSPDSTFETHPKFVFGVSNISVDISCGWYHTLAIAQDKSVYCWGRGDSGQLGIGRIKRAQVLPTKLDYFADKNN